MSNRTQWVCEIRLVGETVEGNVTPSVRHIIREFTEVLDRTNNVNVAMAAFDPETGRRLRKVEFNKLGESTPEHERLIKEELGIDTEEVVA